MNTFFPKDVDNMSNIANSVTSKAETNHGHYQQDDTIQQALSSRQPIGQSDIDQSCPFLGGILDDCYQSRLYARVLEFYFIDNDPKFFGSCRCPMENCRKPHFSDPKEMVLHLKKCKYFKQGLIRCPECEKVEGFRTNSSKGCSWNRSSLKHRTQKKLKAALDTIKRFATSQPTAPLGNCKNCGSLFTPDRMLEWLDGQYTSIPDCCSLDEECLGYKAPSGKLYREILGKELCYEALGSEIYEISSKERPKVLGKERHETHSRERSELPGSQTHPVEMPAPNKLQPSPILHDMFNSGQSPQSNLPSELTSSPISRGDISSAGVSPLLTKTLTTASTENSQCRSVSTNYHEYSESSSDHETIPNIGHDIEVMHYNWQQQQRYSRLYDPSSTHDPAIPMSSLGQSLSIYTGYPEPNVNNLVWDNCNYNGAIPDRMNSMGQQSIGDVSSMTMIETSPLPNTGAFVDPYAQVLDSDIAINPTSISTPSALDSAIQSSSSGQPPESELSDNELCCSACGFKPKGMEKNHRAYFRKHLATHENMVYPCELCGKPYTRRDNMVVHRHKSHPTPNDRKKRRDSSVDINMENQKKKKISLSMVG